MQNQDVRHKNTRLYGQSGNALWYILVAIALLAALTLSMTRNSGKIASNMDQEEASIAAEQLARQASSMATTVQRLLTVNGCSEEEISFENEAVADWIGAGNVVNPKSPTTGARAYSCHVYDARGGGLTYASIPQSILSPQGIVFGSDAGWYITGADSVNGVGPEAATQDVCDGSTRTCGDLIAGVSGVNDAVCIAYNRLVGIDGIPEDTDDYTSVFFVGTYAIANTNDARLNVGSGDVNSALYNKQTACVFSSATNAHNLIYKVLIAR